MKLELTRLTPPIYVRLPSVYVATWYHAHPWQNLPGLHPLYLHASRRWAWLGNKASECM